MSLPPKILIATDNLSDAELVRNLLQHEFGNILASAHSDHAVSDFEKQKPDVLILAFNSLEKAERYYLGLYRHSTMVHALPHRTLVLCNKDEVQRAYELCKTDYFDDYILFWPMTHDTQRLPMAIHLAMRQIQADTAPGPREVAAQVRRLAELEALLDQYSANGDLHLEHASHTLHQAEKDIGAALDRFSRQLAHGAHAGLLDIKDHDSLLQEILRLKEEEIGKPFRNMAAAVQPVREWAGSLRQDFSPQLESARTLKQIVDSYKPVVLIVDDDKFLHRVMKRMLGELDVELLFAATATEALAMLRKYQPDLILMDLELPDIDGIEAIRRIRSVEQFARTPVIMISGHSEKSVVVDSFKAGACDFAVKPFDKDVLLGKIRSYLNLPAHDANPPPLPS